MSQNQRRYYTQERQQQQQQQRKNSGNNNGRRSNGNNATLDEKRKSLPIYSYKDDIIRKIDQNQVVILRGETGSGKSTQLPQYLLEEGISGGKKIACTQPRRVAAKSLAGRVAEEVGCQLGTDVGYQIRHEKKCDDNTKIIFMTDGVFLLECLKEDNLRDYSVVILDEVHERTLNMDATFGLVKEILKKRTTLKVIVTSATMNSGDFSRYFNNADTIEIPGRQFGVSVTYEDRDTPLRTMVNEVVQKVALIHWQNGPGDILTFLTGKEEIEDAAEALEDILKQSQARDMHHKIIQLHRAVDREEYKHLFEPPNRFTRKIILATNIAETSITIEGVKYVVDCGYVKQKKYNPESKVDSLVPVHISQAQADQRKGRAGRTQEGECYRMYTKLTYDRFSAINVPEILRVQLSQVVLLLKSIGINNVAAFDFMDKPNPCSIKEAEDVLQQLDALDSSGKITETGKKMIDIPLEPQLAKILLTSMELECSREIIIILAMINNFSQNLFYRPRKRQREADAAKKAFDQPEGDMLTLLEVYKKWIDNNCDSKWSHKNFVNHQALEEALQVKQNLEFVVRTKHMDIKSCQSDKSKIQKAVLSGYFMNRARLLTRIRQGNLYRRETMDNDEAYISPKSSLFKSPPTWVIFQDIITTNRGNQMHNVTLVTEEWLAKYRNR